MTASNISPYIFPGLMNVSHVNHNDIMDAVCKEFGITLDRMKTYTRKWDALEPRQTAMAIIRWKGQDLKTPDSYANIGRMFGLKKFDHSTVIHSINVVCDRYQTDMVYRERVRKLCERFFIKPQV